MLIDKRQLPWLAGSLVAAGLASGLYVAARPVALAAPGCSWPELGLGIAAALLIVMVSLIGVRRRLPRLSVGSAAGWLRGHLWLSLLSLLCALYHSQFRLGGAVSGTLIVLLILCVGSGLVGALLQQIMPGEISARSAVDSAGDPLRRAALARRQAYELVVRACGGAPDPTSEEALATEREAIRELLGDPPRSPAASAANIAGDGSGAQELARFYTSVMLPFLRSAAATRSPLANAADADLAFDALTANVASALLPTLEELSVLCEKVRQARRQLRMQGWLHGWLLLHVPLAMALLVLLFVHAVTALRY